MYGAPQEGITLADAPAQLLRSGSERGIGGFRRLNRTLVAILGVYVLLSVAWSLATPPYEVSDETSHLAYVEVVASGVLPVMPDNNLEAHQPPGYYLLGAALVKLLRLPPPPALERNLGAPGPMYGHYGEHRYLGGALTVRVLRLLSTALGVVALIFTYLALAQLLPPRWALAGTAFAAFIPQFVVFTSAVNNDPLSYATGAAVLFCAVMVAREEAEGRRRRWIIAMGLSLGLMLWAKEYALALLPVVPISILFSRVGWRRTVLWSIVAWAVALVVASPILIRSQLLYHQPWPFKAEIANLARQSNLVHPQPLWSVWIWTQLPMRVWESLWFAGGWTQIVWPDIVYLIVSVIALPLLVIGLISVRERAAWIPIIGLALMYLGTVYSALTLLQTPGRYLFPALSGFALAVTLGAMRITPRRLERVVIVLLPLAVFGLNIYSLVVTIRLIH